MTTTAQLWHLARKDLTQFRWWFAAYLVAVASSTAVALERALATDSSWPAIVAPLSWILGGLLAAQLVQSDAPANARAYWAGIPIDSRVLLLAKSVIVTTLLCFPPLLGQLLAIEHYGVPTTRAIPMIMASGSVYGAWLLLAMLVALTKGRLAGTTTVGCFPSASPWAGITDDARKVAVVRTERIDSQVASLEGIGIDHWLLLVGH